MGPGINARFSSRGAAFGDYDNDGGMDVLILNMNDLPSLLHNEGNKQNWIKIKLVGTKCNRTAIGARVRVVTGKHAQIDEVHSGTSVMSQSDLRLHFGVGAAETIDAIEVKWPTTQKIERFTQVKANQILTIREGDGIVATFKPHRAIDLQRAVSDYCGDGDESAGLSGTTTRNCFTSRRCRSTAAACCFSISSCSWNSLSGLCPSPTRS